MGGGVKKKKKRPQTRIAKEWEQTRELPASNPPQSLSIQKALCTSSKSEPHTCFRGCSERNPPFPSVATARIIQLWEGIKSQGQLQGSFKKLGEKKIVIYLHVSMWLPHCTSRWPVLEASSVRPIGKVSSRLLQCSRTEVRTALHCSSTVKLGLYFYVPTTKVH